MAAQLSIDCRGCGRDIGSHDRYCSHCNGDCNCKNRACIKSQERRKIDDEKMRKDAREADILLRIQEGVW